MCGLSSETILENFWTPYPHDSSDFGRCYKLLKIFPDWKKRIKEMGRLGKIWERIASAWDELELLYELKNHEKLYKRLCQEAADLAYDEPPVVPCNRCGEPMYEITIRPQGNICIRCKKENNNDPQTTS